MQPDPCIPESLEPVVVPAPPAVREPFWGYIDLLWIIGLLFAGMVAAIRRCRICWFSTGICDDPTPFLLPYPVAVLRFVYLSFLRHFPFRITVAGIRVARMAARHVPPRDRAHSAVWRSLSRFSRC